MGTLYLARHGEAEGDEFGDPGLSDLGRRQVHALAERLTSRPISVVWHSSRRRAVETAGIVAQRLGVKHPRSSALLDDRTPVPSAARLDEYPSRLRPWFDQVPTDERDENGFHLTAAWQEVSHTARSRDMLLVTHAFVIAWFVRQLLRAPAAAWISVDVANAGLTIIDWNTHGEARLAAFNETWHLRDVSG